MRALRAVEAVCFGAGVGGGSIGRWVGDFGDFAEGAGVDGVHGV